MRTLVLVLAALVVAGCSTISGGPTYEQCVPYARDRSGIAIRGDAWTWWDQAAGRYQRSSSARVGSVLVLARSQRLSRGHLAFVSGVADRRHILVDHANWGTEGADDNVHTGMGVIDVSTRGDWTSVRFFNPGTGAYGAPYPALGFIEPRPVRSAVYTGS
ncbi:CHAP domain-containing protein [Zavarzinia sp. CC-PAN008]|uniref:CHAP domain-containing protein n=1 Tax=Zavarzinia sp. CC-PAN008 TaxID=3243332 RepID=UPI003F743DDF